MKIASKIKICGVRANDASNFFAKSWKQLSTWTHSHAKFPFVTVMIKYTVIQILYNSYSNWYIWWLYKFWYNSYQQISILLLLSVEQKEKRYVGQ